MRRVLAVLAFVAVLAVSGAALAETRVALVIGNAAYEHSTKLNNPLNDARAMSEALRRVGFAVTAVENQGRVALEAALQGFARTARTADVALVYYSGHGMEIGGANYIVPVDARFESDIDVEFEAVPLDLVLRAVERARKLRLVILDACRNNPLAAQMQVASASRSVGRGLARVEPAGQTLVAYAAKAGTVADDGSSSNSPYTAALLKYIEQPGLEVRFLFAEVRDEVLAATGNAQEPFLYGSLGKEQLYFVPPVAAAAGAGTAAAQTQTASLPPAPGADPAAYEITFWQSIQDSEELDAFKAYLEEFPNGRFRRLAELRIAALEKAQAEAQQAAAAAADGAAAAAEQEKLRQEALARTGQIPANLIQYALQALGHYKGGADGKVGAGTRRGISAFQSALGAPVTGELTPEQTVALIKAAAEKGQAESENTLGMLLASGVGVPKDDAAAVQWFKRAADKGSPFAMYNLAVMHRDGRGTAASKDEAIRYFRLAKDGGHAQAGKALAALGG